MAIDLGQELQVGKVILVNTAKELLKEPGSSFFGKFILSLLSHAVVERAAMQPKKRLPTLVYIDEAQEYLDPTLEALLSQARKYAVGITLAHQNLDQLDASLRASLAASTSVKFAGGVSEKDARLLAPEMRTTVEFLRERQKYDDVTDFALSVRNVLPRAVSAITFLGFMASLEELSDSEVQELKQKNALKYGRSYVQEASEKRHEGSIEKYGTSEELHKIDNKDVVPLRRLSKNKNNDNTLSGRGGPEHRYLQAMVKEIAEQVGYRAEIEKKVSDGYIDIYLSRDSDTVAIEIALGTDPLYELRNISKCLSVAPSEVFVVSTRQQHLLTLKRLAESSQLPLEHVRFMDAQELRLRLLMRKQEVAPSAVTEVLEIKKNRGYTVRVKQGELPEEEAQERKRRVARVVAQHLGGGFSLDSPAVNPVNELP